MQLVRNERWQAITTDIFYTTTLSSETILEQQRQQQKSFFLRTWISILGGTRYTPDEVTPLLAWLRFPS